MSVIGNPITLGGGSGGGAGLSLYVVGGTTQPSSPQEKTIWINTANTISEWAIQSEEPSNPSANMAWVNIDMSGQARVTFEGDDSTIILIFGFAKQYINGEWATKEAMIYEDGVWKSFRVFLYNYGEYNTAIGGAPWVGWWGDSSKDNVGVSNDFDHLTLTFEHKVGPSSTYCLVRPPQKIDLTNVHTIQIVYACTGAASDHKYRFTVTQTTDSQDVYNTFAAGTAELQTNPSQSDPATVTIDVSNLSGEYYLNVVRRLYAKNTKYTYIYSVELL